MRWLNDFVADGPIPETATFDHGYELSAGHFVIPKKLMVYGRGSQVFGDFKNSYEYGGGVKWHFLPTERLWLNAELMRVHRATLQRCVYSVYLRHERLGADDSDGHRFLRIIARENE